VAIAPADPHDSIDLRPATDARPPAIRRDLTDEHRWVSE
jgi:hypothetical protein